jgi:hypothetical protein
VLFVRKDLLVRYINGAMSNLERADMQLQETPDSSVSSKVHGEVFNNTISSTETRFLCDYLEAIASKALYLADALEKMNS